MRDTLILDTEVFSNYYLAAFLNCRSGKRTYVEARPGRDLDRPRLLKILHQYTVVTFNGRNYDLPLLTYAVAGASPEMIKRASDRIILEGLRPWDFYKEYDLQRLGVDHIDTTQLAPGMVGLKIYGGRLHCPKMQDCPVEFDKPLTEEQMDLVLDYCLNDLDVTKLLFDTLEPQIALRKKMGADYGLDLRSKSDAQIAESVIRCEILKRTGDRIGRNLVPAGTEFSYDIPHWLTFNSDAMRSAIEEVKRARFMVTNKGAVEMPPELASFGVSLGGNVYRMGIGGLHSSEKSVAHTTADGSLLIDRDVASYYPNLILNCGLAPEHLGPNFLEVYREIVQRRLRAKRSGDKVTANTLKIVLNGTFGKLGNMWSAIYSPKLMIQVTLTGQLALLMLIEDLIGHGIKVVSANTDGVVSRVKRDQLDTFNRIVEAWEINCGLETEETRYRALYSRDVNTYLAIKEDGTTKGKGVFADPGLQKNPDGDIVVRAVKQFLVSGESIHDTLVTSRDLREFVTLRSVKGGGMFDGEFLGKAVRWYHKRGETRCITYKSNGYKVAGSEGACPVMTWPVEFPNDIDYGHYQEKANELLAAVGAGEVDREVPGAEVPGAEVAVPERRGRRKTGVAGSDGAGADRGRRVLRDQAA